MRIYNLPKTTTASLLLMTLITPVVSKRNWLRAAKENETAALYYQNANINDLVVDHHHLLGGGPTTLDNHKNTSNRLTTHRQLEDINTAASDDPPVQQQHIPTLTPTAALTHFLSDTDFIPLTCNFQSYSFPCDLYLSDLIAETAEGEEVTVPCRTCILVDYTDGETLTMSAGLNIEGKLYFPPEAHVKIRTTHVWVQGELVIDAPLSYNKVEISLFGTSTAFLTPHFSQNPNACPNGCDFGKKPIAVIGGELFLFFH